MRSPIVNSTKVVLTRTGLGHIVSHVIINVNVNGVILIQADDLNSPSLTKDATKS
jgi:hypothetical protein